MHSVLLFVFLLVAATGAFPPAVPANHKESWAECEAHMDGQLPYYVPSNFNFSGNVRRYYVAAEIETWDYAPSGTKS
jgi:hypothetical protein